MNKQPKSGFTLIELSIVLVIIGLIIGGVLVGQDLIKAAQIRATIQQVERYNTEVRTFQTKYNALPGDIQAQAASNFGMTGTYLLSGNEGDGDGNGMIEDGQLGIGGSNDNLFAGEISEFWAQLSWANLIDGGFGTGLTNGTGVSPDVTAANLTQYVPPAKLGRGMSFTVFSGNGYNFYGLFPIADIGTGGVYTMNTTGIDPITASNIDTKLDDGVAYTGVVIAAGLLPPVPPTNLGYALGFGANTTDYGFQQASKRNMVAAPDRCTVGLPIPMLYYNTDATKGGNDPSCALVFMFQ